jgi:hypothetical protein
LVRVTPLKLRKMNALYAGIDERLEEFLAETPEAELRLVVSCFSRVNAIHGTPVRVMLRRGSTVQAAPPQLPFAPYRLKI